MSVAAPPELPERYRLAKGLPLAGVHARAIASPDKVQSSLP
jgi:hypothetical protein